MTTTTANKKEYPRCKNKYKYDLKTTTNKNSNNNNYGSNSSSTNKRRRRNTELENTFNCQQKHKETIIKLKEHTSTQKGNDH